MSPARVWDGGGWTPTRPRIWDGGVWAPVVPRLWDGATWAPLTQATAVAPPELPPTTDPVLAAIRPGQRHRTTVTLSPGRTLQSALDEALAGRGVASPDSRVLVLIEPGIYEGNTGVPAWVSLVGTTGDPADVTLLGIPGTGAQGVITANNGGLYAEGLTVRLPADPDEAPRSWPKYPVHAAQNRTSIWANAVLSQECPTSAGGSTAVGADGGAGGYTLFYRCELRTYAPGQPVTNVHGPETSGTDPLIVALIESTTNGAISIGQWDPDAAETWVIDTTTTAVTTDHPAHISGGETGTITAPTWDSRDDWPVPTGGLSSRDRRILYGG